MFDSIISSLVSGAILLFIGYCVTVLKGIHDIQVKNHSDHAMYDYRLNKHDGDIDDLRETVTVHGEKFVRLENNKRR